MTDFFQYLPALLVKLRPRSLGDAVRHSRQIVVVPSGREIPPSVAVDPRTVFRSGHPATRSDRLLPSCLMSPIDLILTLAGAGSILALAAPPSAYE